MSKGKALTICGIIIATILAIVAYALPLPVAGLSLSDTGQHVLLMVSAFYLILSIETVLLFAAGLKSLKPHLKRAYIILSIGIILFAIAQTQVPLAVISGFEWITTSGLVVLPYLLSSFFAFWGIRNFARLLGIRDWTTHFRFVMPLSIVLISASLLLPVKLSSVMPTETTFYIFRALLGWELVLGVITAYNTWRIRKTIGNTYREAMTWLFIAFTVYAAVNIHFWILQQVGYDNWYAVNSLELIPLVGIALLFVRAGFAFWKISGEVAVPVKNASPLDVVIYTAGLATNPKEIDPILDTVRQITARMQPNEPISPANELLLSDVYLNLENYLIEKERLRDFNREGLRQDISRRFFHNAIQDSIFWNKVT